MLTLSPRASRMAPKEADAMPLPSEDTTPPVTKTKRLMLATADLFEVRTARNSTGVQVSRSARRRQCPRAMYLACAPGWAAPVHYVGCTASRALHQDGCVFPNQRDAGLIRGNAPARIQPQIRHRHQVV